MNMQGLLTELPARFEAFTRSIDQGRALVKSFELT